MEQAQEAPQISPTDMPRRQRRLMLRQQRVLRYLSRYAPMSELRTNFRLQNLENGRMIHQRNVDANEKRQHAALEARLESLKATWESIGYNSSEIEKLEEAWSLSVIKNKETRKEDKKARKALLREVKESFESRK